MKSSQPTFLLILFFLSVMGGCTGKPVLVGDRGSSLAWHPRFHTAQHGDTLYSIAWKYGQDFRRVAEWNRIPPPYVIRPGQRIRIAPPPEFGRTGRAAEQPSPSDDSLSTTSTPRARAYPLPGSTAPRTERDALPAPDIASAEPAPGEGDIVWQWPTSGELFVARSGAGKQRRGINIKGRRGQPIHAAASGKVVYSGNGLIGYGKLIILKHSNQYLSAYAHNWELLVSEGEQVARGAQIARMGSSGVDQVMLHFEIRHNGKPVDPLHYLPKR